MEWMGKVQITFVTIYWGSRLGKDWKKEGRQNNLTYFFSVVTLVLGNKQLRLEDMTFGGFHAGKSRCTSGNPVEDTWESPWSACTPGTLCRQNEFKLLVTGSNSWLLKRRSRHIEKRKGKKVGSYSPLVNEITVSNHLLYCWIAICHRFNGFKHEPIRFRFCRPENGDGSAIFSS